MNHFIFDELPFPSRESHVCKAIKSPPFLLAVVLGVIGDDDPAVDDVDN